MRVVHYYNWGYFEPISCGADLIAANQLAYFRRRGWDVDVLLMSHADRALQARAFRRRYPWLRSVRLVELPPGEFNFRGQLFAHQRIARSECYRELVRERHDLFVSNYAFSAPLVEPLPPGCSKLLEAVDIITESFAIYERSRCPQRDGLAGARDRFLWNLEIELYGLFDRVVFINEQERRVVEPLCPGRTHFVPPMMPWESRPDREPGSDRALEVITGDAFDLIFVGSNAHPNVNGLSFFYHKIFVPYMRKHQVRMAVVGKVSGHLDFDDFYVTKLGNVPGDLRDYYERSKVVIIPILEGSGLSIKTIECLANGRAVATTPVGARGLRHDPESFLQLDMVADPQSAAAAILDLLASEPTRTRCSANRENTIETNFGPERYFSAMDTVMESLGIPAPASAVQAAVGSPQDRESMACGAGAHHDLSILQSRTNCDDATLASPWRAIRQGALSGLVAGKSRQGLASLQVGLAPAG